MASMIYGVSRNNRSGIGYEPPSGERFEHPKSVDEMIIKTTPLYSNVKYGHPHNIKFTRPDQNTIPIYKLKFKQNFRKSNLCGSKQRWVPKNKIIYVADILSNKVATPILESGNWILSAHNGNGCMYQKLERR